MDPKKRIVLVDDHAILRAGLKSMLASEEDLEIIGEASTGLQALDLCEQLKPDLVILDLSMPGVSVFELLPRLLASAPNIKILVLTMHDDKHYLHQALQKGASGYVLKKAADTELICAIHSVLGGEMYIHQSMMRYLVEDVFPGKDDPNPLDQWSVLSEREQDVLKFVALGYTSTEIAEQLSLSPKTVETYRARGMEKLGLHNRASLVRYALRKGLISG